MQNTSRKDNLILLTVIIIFIIVRFASAQELEPRAYQPAPIGVNAFTLSYTHSAGDILFEPSFPAKDVNANLHLEVAAYYRTFGLFGRFANVSLSLPYSAGHLNGSVEGVEREIYRSGLGDIRARFVLNVKGTPAMPLPEFIKHKSEGNLGFSLVVASPTGQYDHTKVINVGQNRWAVKPELGLSKVFNKWQMDVYGGAWFFSKNNDYLGGTLTQNPIASFQFHLSYTLRPGFWFGVNTNFYAGGRTIVNDVPGSTIQRNSRLGGTMTVPITRNQWIKFVASRGVIATRGGDFTNFGASYSYSWLSK
jgi:hypothetical protein